MEATVKENNFLPIWEQILPLESDFPWGSIQIFADQIVSLGKYPFSLSCSWNKMQSTWSASELRNNMTWTAVTFWTITNFKQTTQAKTATCREFATDLILTCQYFTQTGFTANTFFSLCFTRDTVYLSRSEFTKWQHHKYLSHFHPSFTN